MIAVDSPHIRFVAVDEATTPRDGEVIVDHWWIVHPDHGLVMGAVHRRPGGYPQANRNKAITERIAARYYPWANIEFVPVAYIGPVPDLPDDDPLYPADDR